MAKASEYWEDVSTEYVEVCTLLSMGVCWIFTEWTLTLWVCMCILVCDIEIEKYLVYFFNAFTAMHHAVMVVLVQID